MFKKIAFALLVCLIGLEANAGTIAQDPLFISAQADPRVLLMLSRDEQLSIKAYTDYSDLDGDGYIDATFRGWISYDGYFNPLKCYTYNTTNKRFEAASAATAETVTTPAGKSVTQYICSSKWSGNFLNWATMTRLDIVRKVLYGGYRSTDDTPTSATALGKTVLERAYLPQDAHSFVKVYAPNDATTMQKFTPNAWTSISLCNSTLDSSGVSKDSTTAPSIRIAQGAWTNWDSTPGVQCKVDASGASAPTGGITYPNSSTDLVARVLVCDDVGLTDSISGPGPKCKSYPMGNKKPVGLLQQYGEPDALQGLRFGLITGSWAKNKSGGVLRRNIGLIANNNGKYPNNYSCAFGSTDGNDSSSTKLDEIDFCSGVFVNNQGGMASTLPSTGGIIGTLNHFRISQYDTGNHVYKGATCSNYGAQPNFADGDCADWGNPISEMFLEGLRYINFSNGTTTTATTAFNADDSTYLTGLPAAVTWSDPIPSSEWCAKCNILLMSTGLNSFDGDQTAQSFSGWTQTTAQLTDAVQAKEGLSGSFIIGNNTGTMDPQGKDICTSKTMSSFANALGICPELPAVGGSYHIAGLAYGTSLYDLRPGYQTKRQKLWGVSKPDYAARQPLSIYSVALAESLPSFQFPVGSGKVTILPACQANNDGGATFTSSGSGFWRTCGMTNLVMDPSSNATAGAFLTYFDDTMWGNDHDLDIVSHIRYCVGHACDTYAGQNGMPAVTSIDANKIYIKISAVDGSAGNALRVGYTVTGSNSDGLKLRVLFPGGANSEGACSPVLPTNGGVFGVPKVSCENTMPISSWKWSNDNGTTTTRDPQWEAITPSTDPSAQLLENPLWYAAKYAAWPNWDVTKNDAFRTPGSDSIPDNYFQVRNPAGLDTALAAALKGSLADPSSSSSIATNSTRLDTDTFVYQARFKATDWSGQVLAYPVVSTTTSASLGTLAWDAGLLSHFPSAANRSIFTFNRSASGYQKGIDFKWSALTAKQRVALDNANASNTSSSVLDYLRGDQTNELKDTNSDGVYDTGLYRPRTSIFGDIVNADPVFVGAQDFQYASLSMITGYDTYDAQVAKKFDSSGSFKNPILTVNANDGMMHAIDARNGNEIFTYIPSWLICNDETGSTGCTTGTDTSPLRKLIDRNMAHSYLLDGSIVVGDAYINPYNTGVAWYTVLVGTAAAGGKGVYALNLTNVYDGTSETTSSSSVSATQTNYASITAANTVMWEFTDTYNGDADLGYTFGLPVVGRTADGSWVAIFGNGYGSSTGKAVLYIVNLANGSLLKKIDVGDGSTTSPNGLSAPAAIFNSSTGALTTVYAGDLRGNLWKFNLSDSNTSKWAVDNQTTGKYAGPAPLFTAMDDSGNLQPITAGLEIGAHPTDGYIVYFGTGKYFEKNDNTSTSQQTFYAIRDETASDDQISASSVNTLSKKKTVLYQHSILAEMANPLAGGGNIRVTDASVTGSFDWTTYRGWFINLGSTSGERVVSPAILRNKRVIVTSIIPSASPCDFGGTSWIMEFDPETGNRPSFSVFDLNNNGSFTTQDYVTVGGASVPANAVQSTEGMIKSPSIISAGGKDYKISSGTTGNVLVVTEQGATNRPRPAWRQVQ